MKSESNMLSDIKGLLSPQNSVVFTLSEMSAFKVFISLCSLVLTNFLS